MKDTVKQLWIRALKSGEYKQGHGQLRYDGKYCCLGVLCDLYRKETGQGSWVEGQRFTDGTWDSSVTTLPTGVRAWAGLNVANPRISFENRDGTAAGLNDSGTSFTQIAELIEIW